MTYFEYDGVELAGTVKALVDMGALRPMKRCGHKSPSFPNGHLDGHDTEYDPKKDRALDGHWCPGAGNEDAA